MRKVLSKAARANVRVVADGHPASSGLLEVQTSSGSFGSVCGMNAEAASVACRQLGFDFGVAESFPVRPVRRGQLVWCDRVACCSEELEMFGDRDQCG